MELVVAVAVFAVVAAAVFAGLSTVLNGKAQLEAAEGRLARVQKVAAMLQADLRQVVARPVRDELGTGTPALAGGAAPLLQLTRGGSRTRRPDNPSGLVRVEYRLEEDRLVRLMWPSLDRVQGTEPARHLLLEGVREATTRFRQGRDWTAFWPRAKPPAGGVTDLPKAVEVALATTAGERFRFVVAVGG
jgi:general secretion pathway protein J